MYDVIECFQSTVPRRQTRIIVFQTPNAVDAQTQADQLWKTSNSEGHVSTFVVVDRSTTRELYRVPIQ
jgi:hypothetical protein